MRRLLIDGDIVLYRAAFAAQARKTLVELPDGSSHLFSRKWAARDWIESMGYEEDECTLVTVFDMKNEEESYMIVDNIMQEIFNNLTNNHFDMYLTGKGNYREGLAVTHKYKGNRDDNDKPVFYDQVKQYLIDTYEAEVIDGMEADDKLGIEQGPDTCIVTIDKDLDQIEGWHYNFVHNDLYNVSPDEATRSFQIQCLVGDPTDNIFGLKGVGDKTANKILDGCHPDDAWETILFEYEKQFGDDAFDRLVENARLLYILRKPGEIWEPPRELLLAGEEFEEENEIYG